GNIGLIIAMTSSMQAGRRSWVALFTCADFTDTTGTKVGILSAGRAKQPSLAALIQFDRCCGARSCRRATSAITAPGAIASATIDQTQTAPTQFRLGPLGNLNQVTKGLAKTIRAMAEGTIDSQVGARICNGLGI